MSSQKITRIYIVIILASLASTQSPLLAQQEGSYYNQTQLAEDLDYLVKAIKEIHPDPFAYTTEESFEKYVSQIQSELNPEITRIEFAKLIMPLVTSLKDGHTELDIPEKEYSAYSIQHSETIFPWEVSIQKGNIHIPILSAEPLISINGIRSDSLLNKMRSFTSAERESYREIIIQKRFKRLLWLIEGKEEEFVLLFEGETVPLEFDAEALSSLNASQETKEKSKPYFFELNEELGLGVLTFNSMEKLSEFKKLLERVFDTMSESNTKKLIVDLRNNGGGNSELGDALLDYIAPGPFKQVDKMLIKASAKQKKYIRENYIKWYIYPFVFLNKIGRATFAKNGKISEHVFSPQKPKYNFDGEVLVFTSMLTFSSATILANAIKCYGAGTIIGEETGGNTVFFGDNIGIELPNTKITGTVSFKKFYLPCGIEDLSGVQPDLEIEGINEMSLEEVLSNIEKP